MSIVFILIGVFSAVGGIMDWDWFIDNYRSRTMVNALGRRGARIFYVLVGIATIGFGMALRGGE